MHKIEELAARLHDLSTQLVACSARYVELATTLREGLTADTHLACELFTSNQSFSIQLKPEQLTEDGLNTIILAVDTTAKSYAERIGLVWSEVHKLAESVLGELTEATAPALDEALPETFKVEDDN